MDRGGQGGKGTGNNWTKGGKEAKEQGTFGPRGARAKKQGTIGPRGTRGQRGKGQSLLHIFTLLTDKPSRGEAFLILKKF